MFEIDKEEFGKFVSKLRKEKGYTQKEMAEKLFVSDKAVSKWETGASIPDTALLIPIAELLEVTATELLMCKKIENNKLIETEQVEDIVKTAIKYSDNKAVRNYKENPKLFFIYIISLTISITVLLLDLINGYLTEHILTYSILSIIFGGYFCVFSITKLPKYYDENKINTISDGMLRMNMIGISFNNRNWIHIVRALSICSCICMVVVPILSFVFKIKNISNLYGLILLIVYICTMLLPMYIVGKKYQ